MSGGTATSVSSPLRVAIVEDDRTLRDGLAALIDGSPGYRCVGRYGSVEDALHQMHRGPDVLLLDINLPGVSGSDGVRLFRDRHPGTEILMLSVYEDQENVFRSVCNGAVGYLLKTTPPVKLLEAIREAATGGAPMSPEIARKVVAHFRTPGPRREAAEGVLTPQETRLLQLLADGYGYRAAGEQLAISTNTVRSYIRNVYEKLHVHSKSEAVSKGLRRGLIT